MSLQYFTVMIEFDMSNVNRVDRGGMSKGKFVFFANDFLKLVHNIQKFGYKELFIYE